MQIALRCWLVDPLLPHQRRSETNAVKFSDFRLTLVENLYKGFLCKRAADEFQNPLLGFHFRVSLLCPHDQLKRNKIVRSGQHHQITPLLL